nr:AGE family epimerase/isomerase [Prevotella sp.]
MKKIFATFMLAVSFLVCMGQDATEKTTLKNEIEKDLTENILPFWLNHSVDPIGGFYGEISHEGKSNHEKPKGAVLGARMLWTFSTAYRLYGHSEYKDLADRVQQYFLQHFIDQRYGGVYWTVTPDGAASEDIKRTYAQAFAIYGLAEHFRATGDSRSLDAAIGIFQVLEEKVHDPQKGGYREVLARDFSPTNSKGVDGRIGATKTMNTHIHVLEAFTTLYKVWPDETLRNRLQELIGILESKLYSPKTGHLLLFCDNDWNSMEEVDSYGHDIETSWLLCEAAETLGDDVIIQRIRKQAVKMVDVAIKEGLNPNGSMILEKNGNQIDRRLQWWPQSEAVVGCINAWQITGNRKYFDQAVETWRFVRDNFVDKQYGEWYRFLTPDGKPVTKEPKGSLWNCPYHNSRMGFEMLSRLTEKTVHSEVMAWSNITGVRSDGELIDFESALCVGTPGGKIEKTGRERQRNVKYRREGLTQIVDIPLHGAHFHQEVTDISDKQVKIKLNVEADETLQEGAFFSMAFAPKYYANAKIKASGSKVTVSARERNLTLSFDRKVTTSVKDENGNKVLYVTLLPSLRKGEKADLEALLNVDGTKHHETAHIHLDLDKPGERFIGFGGNFRIQNPKKDPEVIDYCLKNLRVAMGRVEFPWAAWDRGGKDDAHVRESAQIAARLKAIGMPVVVSCWFPPQWALVPGQKRGTNGVAALRLEPSQMDRIYESMASYLVFLKDEYGVEADYFSFNESDIGIDVLHTPQEHCDFIKDFGAKMASKRLRTKMLLGDNSDATTLDFIRPALADKDAH